MTGEAVIRTPDRRLRVFVSSTLEELAEERRAVSLAISTLRLTPVMFELGARPHPPRALYRAYVAQSDVFIGLYWQRYGQVSPGMEISGLEDEYDLSRGLPRLVYVKAPAPDRDRRLSQLLSRLEREASYRTFGTPEELGRLVEDDLATLLSERFAAAQPSPPRAAHGAPRLPVATTSLVGRGRDVEDAVDLLGRPGIRLVTLTGPGGIGKTRLAMAVGEQLRERFEAGTVFVALAGVTERDQALAAIGRAVRADLGSADSPLQTLIERLGDGRWLLILDNLEGVLDVARDLNELLAVCPGVTILGTSLTALSLRAEHEYPVLPLLLPADPNDVAVEELASSPAVALFVERARAVRPDFALTPANARSVAEICRRLEGVPLAIELAAARSRLLDPNALLSRLVDSLDTLRTGTVDMPERHQTLRAAVEWSVGLLDGDERSLLETLAVFADGWTLEAAAQVAALDDDRALDLTEGLARHSLIYLEPTDRGPRSRMLETIREFVAERLKARADVSDIEHRHAKHYRALIESADRPLRGAGQSEWAERLQAERGNLAVAIDWWMTHDRAPLPHLFRILALYWALRDRGSEARAWIDQLLPAADSLAVRERAELVWTAAMIALESGDDAATLAARTHLAPLLDEIDDPYLHVVSQLVMTWSSPISGSLDDALSEAVAALQEVRTQDEPFVTAVALVSAGALEIQAGRFDDALRHLTEVRDAPHEFDSPWLFAWCTVQLGVLAVLRGRFEDARTLIDKGLGLSLAGHSTRFVTLSLEAFARLAFAEGDPERAAFLGGAAEGLRDRIGVRTWPSQRRSEAEFAAELRDSLGPKHFDELRSAGSGLSQQEAVSEARSRGPSRRGRAPARRGPGHPAA